MDNDSGRGHTFAKASTTANPRPTMIDPVSPVIGFNPSSSSRGTAGLLAPDILFEIGARHLPADLTLPSNRVAPLNLSQVCRSWRNVIANSPALWATFYYSERGDDEGTCDSIFNGHKGDKTLVQQSRNYVGSRKTEHAWALWLARSRDCPLTISIHSDARPSPARLVEMTLHAHRRWRRCSIRIRELRICNTFRLCLADMPMLEEMHLEITTSSGPAVVLDMSTSHPVTLGTQRMMLSGPFALPLSPTIEFGRLKNLVVRDSLSWNPTWPAWKVAMAILSSTPNLEFLEVTALIDGVAVTPCITLPRLRRAKFVFDPICANRECHTLRALTLPALENLEVIVNNDYDDPVSNVWSEVRELLRRTGSANNLQCLTLSGAFSSREDEDHIISILCEMHGLRELYLRHYAASVAVLGALVISTRDWRGAEVIMCPHLEILSVQAGRLGCPTEFPEVVASRWQTKVHALYAVEVVVAGKSGSELVKRADGWCKVEECVSEGLILNFRSLLEDKVLEGIDSYTAS